MKQCKNNDNTLIISILFICLLFDWYKKKTSRHWNFGETFMFVGVAVRKKFLKTIHYGWCKDNKNFFTFATINNN